MLLKKKFTDADHISVPNFWTSQYPELWVKQTFILYISPNLRYSVVAMENRLTCSKYVNILCHEAAHS
jgi:hypothetical protein